MCPCLLQVLQTLQQLFQDCSLCDYTIIAEGQTFKTHRNVLAAVSDYFRAMLTGSMMEARQDHVDLKGVTSNAVKLLLDFAYSGELVLNLDDVMEVLAGACHLQMRTAIDLCCQFLLGEISSKTCVDILNIAEMFTLIAVKNAAIEYVIENFEKVADGDQLFKLHREHLCIILQSSRLKVMSELVLFHHVVQWVDCDRAERHQGAAELFRHIRFAMMSAEELVDQVSQTYLMTTDAACRAFLDEALHYHLLPQRHPLMQTSRTQVRNEACLVAFGGKYGIHIGYKHNSNKMYVLQEDRWLELPSTETNFLYAAVAVVDNFMYVCGGMGKPAHARATCQRFDPRTRSWARLAHMKTRRQSFPLVAHNGKLYAFGGGMPVDYGLEHPPTDKAEVYSIDRNEWRLITSLPGKRKSASACEFGGKIYISGGRTENETMMTFWCFNPSNETWEDKNPMLLSHAGHAMLATNDKIYVIDRTNTSIECYNPLTDEWSKVAPPIGAISGVARPAIIGAWVYFISFVEETDDYQCRRINVVTLAQEHLPVFPEQVHCVIGAPLAFPRNALVDSNNNP